MWIAVYVLGVVVATAIVWVGAGLLEGASERLALYYELPDIVQGAIVVAVGSSFPELSTIVVSAALHDSFPLGVAAIVGSALFNVVVIPGVSGLAGEEQLESNRALVYKEAQFYMIAVSVLLLTFAFGTIYYPASGPESGDLYGDVTRPLATIPIALYGLYIFVQYQDSMDFVPDADTADLDLLREWGKLVVSLGVILGGVELMIQSVIGLGDLFGIADFFWGVTVVAAGTSIPDVFVSVRAARSGNAVTSLANVLGSNIFDLLVAIPVGVLIVGAATINFTRAVPMMSVLTLATILLFAFMRTKMTLNRAESVALLVFYGLFVLWMGLETLGITRVILSSAEV